MAVKWQPRYEMVGGSSDFVKRSSSSGGRNSLLVVFFQFVFHDKRGV